jgi:hypothetical protein
MVAFKCMEEGKQDNLYTKEHYREMAKWFERVGIGALGAIVVQRLISGSTLIDPLLVLGFIVAVIVYFFAFKLLAKS